MLTCARSQRAISVKGKRREIVLVSQKSIFLSITGYLYLVQCLDYGMPSSFPAKMLLKQTFYFQFISYRMGLLSAVSDHTFRAAVVMT